MPIVAGSEINDDPYNPVSKHAINLIEEHGDDTPIEWVHRSTRYGEKLATPDTSVADLIGEVDPIKVAEGRYLSDELTIHYGLIPRTNRGIFAINELPDLAERIQVGLLNVLEERDVQVRGYKIRLPLDVMLVATANPDDYTNRGRIITPLKDRFGAQVRTHYPLDIETEIDVVKQEPKCPTSACASRCPTSCTRSSPRSRTSPAPRARSTSAPVCRCASPSPTPRRSWPTRCVARPASASPSPCRASATSTRSPVRPAARSRSSRWTTGATSKSSRSSIKSAVLTVFKERCPIEQFREVPAAFEGGTVVHAGDDVPGVELRRRDEEQCRRWPRRRASLAGSEDPPAIASAIEFILEGLHLSKRLNKDSAGGKVAYRAR